MRWNESKKITSCRCCSVSHICSSLYFPLLFLFYFYGKYNLTQRRAVFLCNEISTLTVNYVRIINHFSTSLITYCKPWWNGINSVKRTQFSLIDFSKTGAETLIKMLKEELKHNKAVRGAYKGHCNQDIKRAERLMADTEAINITELKASRERLSRRLDEIKAMDTAILKAL